MVGCSASEPAAEEVTSQQVQYPHYRKRWSVHDILKSKTQNSFTSLLWNSRQIDIPLLQCCVCQYSMSSLSACVGPAAATWQGICCLGQQPVLRCYCCQGAPEEKPIACACSNSPFKTIALFRKVIEPQAAPSFCTRYIIDKQWHSSIHSSHTPCGPELGLVVWNIVVCFKPGLRKMSESKVQHRNLSYIHIV